MPGQCIELICQAVHRVQRAAGFSLKHDRYGSLLKGSVFFFAIQPQERIMTSFFIAD